MPNISRIKDNQTMKFGQLIEYNKINFFLQKTKKKALHKVKAGSLQLGFNKFWLPSNWHTIKTNCIKL